MKTTLISDIPLGIGEEITYKRRNVKKINLPPYDGFGGNTRMKTKVEGYDNLFGVLRNLSKSATWLWWGLLEQRNYLTNECIFVSKNGVEAKKVSKAYKELRNVDLVVRISRQHYLINPIAYLPDFNNFEQVHNHWKVAITKN